MKSKDLKARLLYPARLSFKIEGEIRSFPDNKKLKEFVNTKPLLQQMLKGLLERRRMKRKRRRRRRRNRERKKQRKTV